MSTPGVDFLLAYAASKGALVERTVEGGLLVLPDELQRQLDVEEILGVTEDPEVARDDHLQLLSSGHPMLSNAADVVLAAGDVGAAHVPWPPAPPPDPSTLQSSAREQLHVAHGRIDVAGAPKATQLPVLRVGALVTFSVSVHERIQEMDEVFVEAETGQAVPDELCSQLRTGAVPSAPPGASVPARLREGVAGAHRTLLARAERRVAELARQSGRRLRTQLEVVDDYYKRVIDSLDERRARATAERARMLEAQGAAAAAEWRRRRAEVTEELTPTFELRPFRVHLLFMPAYDLPVVVRRGERGHGLDLTYLPLQRRFVAPHCPACGSSSPLVAAKDRLGCESCIDRESDLAGSNPPARAAAPRAPSHPDRAADDVSSIPPPVREQPGTPMTATERTRPPSPRVTASAPNPSTTTRRDAGAASKARSGRVTPKGSRRPVELARTGNRLAREVFERAFGGGHPKQRAVIPGSPFAALLDLYGVRGPALLLGMEDDERPRAISTSTELATERGWATTLGTLRTSVRERRFLLHWRPDRGAAIAELEAFPLEFLGRQLLDGTALGSLFRHDLSAYLRPAPVPRFGLATVPSRLLEASSRLLGLGFAMRCIAAWRYLDDPGCLAGDAGPEAEDDVAAAAAVLSMVAKRAGLRLPVEAVADACRAEVGDARAAERRLGPVLRKAPDARW